MSERALIFGASGQVGLALQQTASASVTIVAHDSRRTDVRDHAAIARAIDDAQPDLVVNCAAFTNVDRAEAEADDALAINGVAAGCIAELASAAGARLIHVSTDYVFDGRAHRPYAPNAEVAPINTYGATKLEGERRVLASAPQSVVVRTAWVHSGTGVNFIRTAVRMLTAGNVMRVVDDQIGTPTRALHLAQAIWRISARPHLQGVLHFTDAGVASWFDVAEVVHAVLKQEGSLGAGASVVPRLTDEAPRPAARPHFSVMDKHASWEAIGFVPPHWRDGVIASTREALRS